MAAPSIAPVASPARLTMTTALLFALLAVFAGLLIVRIETPERVMSDPNDRLGRELAGWRDDIHRGDR